MQSCLTLWGAQVDRQLLGKQIYGINLLVHHSISICSKLIAPCGAVTTNFSNHWHSSFPTTGSRGRGRGRGRFAPIVLHRGTAGLPLVELLQVMMSVECKTRTCARSQLQQWTHQSWWRAPLRLHLFPLLQTDRPSSQNTCHRHHQQCSDIEMKFVIDALPVKVIGMNSTMMCDYIKFCANWLLISLGWQIHNKNGNSFELMEMISLQGKTSFFEKCVEDWRILKIWSRSSGQRWPDICPRFQLLTPYPTRMLHLLHYAYMLHNTLFPVGTPAVPPILTPFASVAWQKPINTGMIDVH